MRTISDGEVLVIRGYQVQVRIEYDADGEYPWENCVGMGHIRREHNRRNKRAGEQPFGSCWMFDFRKTTEEAKRDGWGIGKDDEAVMAQKLGRPPTRAEVTSESVRRQFEYLKAWATDEWQYYGYVVTLLDGKGKETEHFDSCWGFEYWLYDDEKNQYFFDEVYGAAEQLVEAAEAEQTEVRYWHERDVVTEAA